MKNQIVIAVIVIAVVGLVNVTPASRAERETKNGQSHNDIALIDMAHVLQNSTEFKIRKKALSIEVRDADRSEESQKRFFQKEALIYKEVYLKAQQVLAEIAGKRRFAVVIRFNRNDVGNAKHPKAIISSLNRIVVFYDKKRDLTDNVLKELNRRLKEPRFPQLNR